MDQLFNNKLLSLGFEQKLETLFSVVVEDKLFTTLSKWNIFAYFEDGKYYPMMKVVPVSGSDLDLQKEETEDQVIFDRFGEYLLKQKNPILKQYLDFSEEMTGSLIVKLKEQSTGFQRHMQQKQKFVSMKIS